MAIALSIFLVSAATLGLELVLVRALSIGHWHHLSFMVISTALLGFGAGGTIVTVAAKWFTKNHLKMLCLFAFALALSVPAVFRLSQTVPLDELQLIWDSRQIIYLLAYYLLFFIPFLFAGLFISLVFSVWTDRAFGLYFYNLIGSGFGAAFAVAMFYWLAPEELLVVISIAGFFASVLVAAKLSRTWVWGVSIAAMLCLLIFGCTGLLNPQIRICQNKFLVYYRALPDSETIAVRHSPLARIDCIRAPSIRYFPGLSISYQGQLPQQILIISDADGVTAVNKFSRLSDADCYKHTTSALAYHLINAPEVCVIGAGGGSDILGALVHKVPHVTAIEMNPQIIDLVRNELNHFTSGLYVRGDVEIIKAEGRNFLQTTTERFDIINVSLLDSFSASAAGVYALNESHLYTLEAIEQAFVKLKPNGILSITRPMRTPPRDALKMLATIAEALRHEDINEPAGHIIMIRSWATATIVASVQPFSDSQILNAHIFSQQNSFDLIHLPGIEPRQVNQYHILPEPVYYQSAQQILLDDAESFYKQYAYNIRPATDDRPYFFDFFKWKALPHMIRTLGRQWLTFSQWNYLLLVATLAQSAIVSAILILLPLLIAKPIRTAKAHKFATAIYFFCLGLAYMFLEMGFIQKLTLLIGHPIFGVAATITGFLIFSGLGSIIGGKLISSFNKRPKADHTISTASVIWFVVLAIIITGIIELVILAYLFDLFMAFSQPLRFILGIVIVAPLAFFMGIPFPSALKELHAHSEQLVPWAWGINGFASVTGAVLGTFVAISLGFTTVILTALACYLVAGLCARRICGQTP
ncbi:MAG: hypothetical protein JXB29_10770 [Sedimentisphaerales bacterium]|nr:hypothetical protein [Sedimentisphaerales bacterium]